MTLTALDLLIYALAVFRLAYFLSRESGPAFFMWRIRKAAKKNKSSSLAEGIQCPYCVEIWCAIALTIFVFWRHSWPEWVNQAGWFMVVMLAVGGASMLLHQTFVYLRRE